MKASMVGVMFVSMHACCKVEYSTIMCLCMDSICLTATQSLDLVLFSESGFWCSDGESLGTHCARRQATSGLSRSRRFASGLVDI